jgi:hypothetical protein
MIAVGLRISWVMSAVCKISNRIRRNRTICSLGIYLESLAKGVLIQEDLLVSRSYDASRNAGTVLTLVFV